MARSVVPPRIVLRRSLAAPGYEITPMAQVSSYDAALTGGPVSPVAMLKVHPVLPDGAISLRDSIVVVLNKA
jgi:hypothetical protein